MILKAVFWAAFAAAGCILCAHDVHEVVKSCQRIVHAPLEIGVNR
jgi:hypothetical protein